MPWNVLLTTQMRQEARTMKALQKCGQFRRTPFRGILLGEVKEPEIFLDSIKALKTSPFQRAIPFVETFEFEAVQEQLLGILKEKIKPLVTQIADSERYDVAVERRGLKGIISGHEIEEELRSHIVQLLKAQGKSCQLDWKDPDKVITIQTVEKLCGIGLITRAISQRWPFVRPE